MNFKNSNPEFTSISIVNVLGEKIRTINSVSGGTAQINLPEATSGVYYVQINSGSTMITKKVFITK